jgi:antitoxin PrlF
MAAARVTRRGRVTIPAEVRQALQVAAGDRIEFVQVEPGRFEVMAVTRSVKELKGMFGKPRNTVSIEEMNPASLRHPLR